MGGQALWDSIAADAMASAASWIQDYSAILVMFTAVLVLGLVLSILESSRR